jgi:pimeloyl-ACP methyl ester carboxylesterase
MDLVLLPGMDGTARLFEPFVRALPAGWSAAPVRYPPDRPLGYHALLDQVPVPAGDFVLVAESFGGPLALKVAAKNPTGLKAVVLVATFVDDIGGRSSDSSLATANHHSSSGSGVDGHSWPDSGAGSSGGDVSTSGLSAGS